MTQKSLDLGLSHIFRVLLVAMEFNNGIEMDFEKLTLFKTTHAQRRSSCSEN
jgi:hypothetical protein